MLNQLQSQTSEHFHQGLVVALAPEVFGVQSPDGDFLPSESLGPGIVRKVGHDDNVQVYWEVAGFSAWLDTQDLRSLGANAHLVTIQRRDKHGKIKMLRHKVVTTMGLQHNWKVDFLPGNIVRTVRSDGASWTFSFDSLFQRIKVWWSQPRDDDDAEALAAADLSIR